MERDHGRLRRAMAWGVHLYTALGLPLAFFAAVALARGDASVFFIILWTATFVDATDGTLARAVKVREVLPQFDGRRLDDIVDYLMFAFLPSLGFAAFSMLPPGLEYLASIPMLASGYGFCQESAKTEDSFVGFPSYWNIVILYLYILNPGPWYNLAIIGFLSVMVFVPIHYLYPTKTQMLKRTTLSLGLLWSLVVIALAANVNAAWAPTVALWSLAFPAYYVAASIVHHRRIHAEP